MKKKKSGCVYGHIRKTNSREYYQTPYLITERLLERENFRSPILEPACGDGAIVKVLKEKYEIIDCYDLKEGKNFLDERKKYNSIITNPPFSKTNEFILKAKRICLSKFAFFIPLDYLHGRWRYGNIYSVQDNFPLKRLYIFVRRPLLNEGLREDGRCFTGMITYAWFIWERSKREMRSNPKIFWIDNQGDICSDNKIRIKDEGNLSFWEEINENST